VQSTRTSWEPWSDFFGNGLLSTCRSGTSPTALAWNGLGTVDDPIPPLSTCLTSCCTLYASFPLSAFLACPPCGVDRARRKNISGSRTQIHNVQIGQRGKDFHDAQIGKIPSGVCQPRAVFFGEGILGSISIVASVVDQPCAPNSSSERQFTAANDTDTL
jgi:hypothetical protein